MRRRGLLAWCWRSFWWLFFGIYFTLGLGIAAMRYWVLPKVPEYREAIAEAVSKSIGERVTIGGIDAVWTHLHPRLELSDVRVHDRAGNVALTLPSIAATIGWRSLLVWDVRFHSLAINRPKLDVRRTATGQLLVAGIEIRSGGSNEPGLGDWVLRQGELVINGGELDWTDETRNATTLALKSVDFRLVNELGNRHRVALRAVPPPNLASALDVRADLKGRSLTELSKWQGELYAQFDYTDLAGWRQWIDYPLTVSHGRGGLRVWLGFEESKIVQATADLALADVTARLRPELPELHLKLVHGRLGAREARQGRGFLRFIDDKPTLGYRVFGENIELVPAQGKPMPPLDFSIAWDGGATPEQARGEFSASGVELEPLVELAESFPFPRAVRAFLAQANPRGKLAELGLAWTGPAEMPRAYSGRGRFTALALNGDGPRPGFVGLTGTFEASQKGGAIQAGGDDVELIYPAMFHGAPRLRFDQMAASVGWSWQSAGDERVLEIKLPNMRFQNQDIEAVLSGSWRSQKDTRGVIDLTANIPRADVKAVHKYIPFIDGKPAEWLKAALLAGRASEGLFRMKGELSHFPFDDPKRGLFEVHAKFVDGKLRFADQWPSVDDIAGEYAINGLAMTVIAQRAAISGVPVGATRVHIPNFFAKDPVLSVDGSAEGPTADFLKYIASTPVRQSIGGSTDALRAEGNGRLALRLELPLDRMGDSKVAGQFQLNGNQLAFAAEHPPLTQLTGRLDFSNGGIEAREVAAQFLGGPVTFNLGSRNDGLLITGQGSASIDAVRRAYDIPFIERAQGALPYRATVAVGPKGFDLNLDSSLQGVSSDLPPPFGKEAAESVPLRLERVIGPEGTASRRDSMSLSIGRILNVQARFRAEGEKGEKSVLDRMGVAIGEVSAALPDRAGITITGDLKTLDYDRLAAALPKRDATSETGARAGAGETASTSIPSTSIPSTSIPITSIPITSIPITSIPITSIQLRANELIAFGRRFNEMSLRIVPQGDVWNLNVASREANGELTWRPEGQGRVTARLEQFTLPEASAVVGAVGSSDVATRDLPSVDLIAENFTVGANRLGRLELRAVNEAKSWNIENLAIIAPEGAIRAVGTWRPGARGPSSDRTEMKATVEVADAGKYLARFSQPNAVAGAKAKLEGTINWHGPPTSIDYPSLSGQITFRAEKGQFLKVDPGIGRLLGVLSLQSLPRRISLDFRDVFSDGFAFDDIAATANIAKGVLTTDDFRMAGPAAVVVIKGDTDLSREVQNLHVKVVPVVGDSIAAVAGLALLNPVVGLGTLLAQRLLRDPLGRIFAYEYAVTGGWADPKVERVSRIDRPRDAEGTP